MSSSPTVETLAPTPTATPPVVRPENPNVSTLKAAFPDVDSAVISAVLIASSNNLEKAFDGLLGMSDPNFTPDPPVAPTPVPAAAPTTEEERQILADEQFARQLAAQHRYRDPVPRDRYAGTTTTTTNAREDATQERSFLDDELPVLKENLIQGFNETKLKVGSFISNLRNQVQARMEGGDEDGYRAGSGHAQSGQQGFGQFGQSDVYHAHPRASTQYDRDARTLDDDFGELQMQDNTVEPAGITIPKTKESDKELAHSAGIGPSKATPNTSRWQPIGETTTPSAAKKEKDSFALGDDEDE